MQPIAQAKGLQLTAGGVDSAINPGSKVLRPLAIVEADRDRVQEVITNFIDNAVKYTPKGSVTVKLDQDDTSATVSVIDTGMGISPEEQRICSKVL
jgi:signal transduction histidine kinase